MPTLTYTLFLLRSLLLVRRFLRLLFPGNVHSVIMPVVIASAIKPVAQGRRVQLNRHNRVYP